MVEKTSNYRRKRRFAAASAKRFMHAILTETL